MSTNVASSGRKGSGEIFSAPVRTTNETLAALAKGNRRFGGPPIAMA